MAGSRGRRPVFRQTDMTTLVRSVERKPAYYPDYQFTGRTFVKRDVPGRKPQ